MLLGAAAHAQRDLVGVTFEARIVSITDGDTVDAIPAGDRRPIRIRLEGIDAPERGEAFSAAATRATRVMLFDQTATVVGRDVDRYGRLVARIFVGGTDASLALVRSGVACHYAEFSSDAALARAQAEARRAGVGFWAPGAAKPECATRTGGSSQPDTRRPIAARTEFRGNTSSRVYHKPTCRNYGCRNCTRVFASEADAKAAGYRPAGDCF